MSRINKKRFGLATFAAFVFIFIYEMMFHGVLLRGLYESTAPVWRTEQEMQNYMGWAVATQIFMAGMFTWLYLTYGKVKDMAGGCRFGAVMGLFLGGMQFGYYLYMPIPMTLAAAWLIGSVIEGIGLGALLTLMYKPWRILADD